MTIKTGWTGTEVAIDVGWVSGATGITASYQEIGTGEGLPLIIGMAGMPANMYLIPTGTASSFDPQKESELRRYFAGSAYGTRAEIPSGVNGSLTVDLVRNAAGNGYDPAIDVLERAAIEPNRLVFMQTRKFMGYVNGKKRYEVRAASFTVNSQHPIDSNAKQQVATYNLQSADAPIVGYFDID